MPLRRSALFLCRPAFKSVGWVRYNRGMKLAVLAEKLGASLAPAPGKNLAAVESLEITGVAGLEKAGPREVSFLTNVRYSHQAKATKAAALAGGARRAGVSGDDAADCEPVPGVCAGAGDVSSDAAVPSWRA